MLLSLGLSSCVGEVDSGEQGQAATVRYCPERTTLDEIRQPRNAAGQIRWCWPGEANCYCDSDNDCYALDGYVTCTQPPVDAGVRDAATATDVVAPRDAVTATDVVAPRDVATATDVVAPRDVATATDVVAPRDVVTVVDAGSSVCPREATTRDSSGQPRNAAGQIRWCWPDEANCFCDADRDCYALTGYTPRCATVIDAGVRDAGPLDTGVRDVGVVDAGPRDTGVVDTGARDVPAVDAGPVSIDTVAYTGSIAVRTGRFTATLTVAGEARQVVLYVPTTRAAQPPLLLMFHGTNGDGNGVVDESGAQAMANANGVIVAAPSSRWMSHGDWDHATEETYWETYPNVDPNSNPDLLLVRAVIAEAQRRYNVDPARVYAAGHSNGGFFTELVAGALSDRVAAFATSSAGLVRCNTTLSCGFQGRGATCASLRAQSGWCGCAGVDKPGALPASGRRPPGLLLHGTSDPMVSVYYTCAMADRMTSLGYEVSVSLRDGDGHVMPSDFASQAWAFVGSRRRP